MRYQRQAKTIVVFALVMALVLASCSGSGSGNSGATNIGLSSLVVADHVSVVDSKSGGGGGAKPMATGLKALLLGLMSSELPVTSDYMKDATSVYVNERSTESFQTINEILCMVRQTRYDVMVNRGPYLALVDENSCRSDKSNASSGGSQSTNTSSGANMPSYMTWVAESIRTSNSLPQIVNFWIIPNEANLIILGRMTITKGTDAAPPYGTFKFDFQMINPNTHEEWMRGVLVAEQNPMTGDAVLRFASNDPFLNNIESATLVKSQDGAVGHGTVLKSSSWSGTTDRFDIAYNNLYFRRHNTQDPPDADICLDRNKFSESAWSYGLYNLDGSRFNLNSGFSIKIGQDYGWIGYWGVWLPDLVTLGTGSIVYRHDFDTNTDTPYTVFQAGGKLKRHNKNSLALSEIANIPLYWWDFNTSSQYTIIWDGSNFQRTAKQDNSGQWINCVDGSIPCGPADAIVSVGVGTQAVWYVNLATLNSSDINVWSQALSGSVRVSLGAAAPGTCSYVSATNSTNCIPFNSLMPAVKGATPVVFYTENIVYPGDAIPPTLACFDNCPLASALTTSNPFRTDVMSYQSGTTPDLATYASYSFDTINMILTDGAVPITAATSTLDPRYQWGITSGALFAPTSTNLAKLDCDWDKNNDPLSQPGTCGWKAWSELTEFYTWETGPNSWNQLIVLRDSTGAFIRFDPPLQIKYTHVQNDPTASDAKYNNTNFYLEYNGFGSLSGIPGVCVDIDTGKVGVSCGPNTWWVPEFLIPASQDSINLTQVYIKGNINQPLIIKPLQIEQRMIGVDITTCAGLSTQKYPLSDMHEWREPAIGMPPKIKSGPKVVGGVIQ